MEHVANDLALASRDIFVDFIHGLVQILHCNLPSCVISDSGYLFNCLGKKGLSLSVKLQLPLFLTMLYRIALESFVSNHVRHYYLSIVDAYNFFCCKYKLCGNKLCILISKLMLVAKLDTIVY